MTAAPTPTLVEKNRRMTRRQAFQVGGILGLSLSFLNPFSPEKLRAESPPTLPNEEFVELPRAVLDGTVSVEKAIKQSSLKIPFVVVITDPVTLHRAWITKEADQVIVATPEAQESALKYGMPEEKLKVIGMPIDPKFFLKDKEKQAARKKIILNQSCSPS